MALADVRASYAGTTSTQAAPTTSETILAPDSRTLLCVTIGGTATVVTLVRPGNDVVGVAVTDVVSASLTSVTKWFKVDEQFIDPTTGNATVTFSQVTAVTAQVVRI